MIPKLRCNFCDITEMIKKTYNKNNGKCKKCRHKEEKEKIVIEERKKLTKKQRDDVWCKVYLNENIGICFLCNTNIISQTNFVVAHKQAVAKGGISSLDNYAPICAECNSQMGTQHMDDFINKMKNHRIENITKLEDEMCKILRIYKNKIYSESTKIDAETQTEYGSEVEKKNKFNIIFLICFIVYILNLKKI